MKTLYVLSGIPGSGKSTWAKQFFAAHKDNTYIVASDDIRMELGGSYQYFKEEANVWKIFYDRIREYSKKEGDVNVIADSTCLQNQFRVLAFTEAPTYDKYVLVFFNIDPEIAKARNELRPGGKVVVPEGMAALIKELEQPNEKVRNIFDEVIIITK